MIWRKVHRGLECNQSRRWGLTGQSPPALPFWLRHFPVIRVSSLTHAPRLPHHDLLLALGTFCDAVWAAARGDEGEPWQDGGGAAAARVVGTYDGAGVSRGFARLVFRERDYRLRVRGPCAFSGAAAHRAAAHHAAHPLLRGAARGAAGVGVARHHFASARDRVRGGN